MAAEVTPISSNGYIGNVTAVAITLPEPPAPVPVIRLLAEDGMVTVCSDTYIESAQLIFVSYDVNGNMIDVDIPDTIEIQADMPEVYGPSELEEGVTTKAMLWESLLTAKPLTADVEW